jgi:cell division protein FtsB
VAFLMIVYFYGVKIPKYLKNKYIITSFLFVSYLLFLDDMDVFSMISNLRKRNALTEQNMLMHQKVIESRATLNRLKKTQYLEHYARSTKYFKQKDEEIFVIIPKGNPKQ